MEAKFQFQEGAPSKQQSSLRVEAPATSTTF